MTCPPRLQLQPWTRLFSTQSDGYSLGNLYSRLKPFNCPLLLIIQDTTSAIFGALLSAPNIKMAGRRYLGNASETFLFVFKPTLTKFVPTGLDNYFIQAMPDGVSIGGGLPAIWIDDNLDKGSSHTSPTFDNPPLSSEPEFRVRQIECWGLDENIDWETTDVKHLTQDKGVKHLNFEENMTANRMEYYITPKYLREEKEESTDSPVRIRNQTKPVRIERCNSPVGSWTQQRDTVKKKINANVSQLTKVMSNSPCSKSNLARALPEWRSPHLSRKM
jgi:hypothetical protein